MSSVSNANTVPITDTMTERALGEYERPAHIRVEEVTCDCCGEDVYAEFVRRLPEELGGFDVCPACMDLYADEVMDKVYKKLDSGAKAEVLGWLLNGA